MNAHEPLSEYPVTIELPILWGYMDAFQHVNNAVYLRFFESVRIAYGDRVNMYRIMQETSVGPILAEISCRYLKPLTYPDTIRVGCRTIRLTPSRIEQEYAIFSERTQRLTTVGTGTVVAYDYQRLQRAVYPQRLLEAILEMEKGLALSPDPVRP